MLFFLVMRWFVFSWQNFWFSFLALAFEGVPFILLGSLISGIIGSFVPARVITGLLAKSRFPTILVSGLLGVVFPVCDCGTVPIVRRILKKGVPLSCGITYMLASPIVNLQHFRRVHSRYFCDIPISCSHGIHDFWANVRS